jgi:hypothetical protein
VIGGAAGAVFWLVFFGILVGCAVATRRHDRRAELDVYERMNGAPW